MRSFKQSKLPLTANWWRTTESNKENPDTSMQSESLESLVENTKIAMEREDMSLESILYKDTTLDSIGTIDTSKILMPIQYTNNKELYEEICQQLKCPTSRKFVKTLNKIATGTVIENINMAHYGLNDKGFRSIILSDLVPFTKLDLQGNIISENSMIYLISLLKQSQITELNLSCMDLARFNASLICSWLSSSKTIQKLYLRNNNFDDNSARFIFESIATNRSLQELTLSGNNFSTLCGDSIKKMMEVNDTLEVLDLSWNHLRREGASSLSKGLKKNNGLKSLILNWNGFEDAGVKELAMSFQDNEYLEELEVECNRITDVGFGHLLKALEKNTTLKVLKVGWNSISQDAAEKGLESIKSGAIKGCSLKVLDFTNIIFRKNFNSIVDSVHESRLDFKCIYGYQDSYGKRKMGSYDPVAEALQFLRVYLERNKINLLELFVKFDADDSMNITYDEFRQGLKQSGIPFLDTQVEQLIKFLDSDGDGEIDFSELVIATESPSEKELLSEKEKS